jgi:hypothetical protein
MRMILVLGLALLSSAVAAFGQLSTEAAASQVLVAPAKIKFPAWRFVERTATASEYTISFDSPVVSPYIENNHIDLRVFVPEDVDGARPAVLILHYLGANDLRSERVLANELCSRGIIGAIMTLPYHLSRTPAGHKSGELAIQPDPDTLRESMTQSVLDVRRCIDFLQSRSEVRPNAIGIAGISLGSLVAATSFGVDNRISHGAFMLGGADVAKIIWNSSRVVTQREVLRRKGFDEAALRAVLRSVEPLEFLPSRKTGTSFVIGGLFDTVMLRAATEELIKALPNPRTLWIETGHYGGVFIQQRLLRLVASYFEGAFAGNSFALPASIYAPTLRVGLTVDTRGQYEVGAGLDLWKFDAKSTGFMTLFLTPKGPQIFTGTQIASGTSLGISLSGRGLGAAIMWSSVL